MTGALSALGMFLGGLALFLFGMETASDALKQAGGGRLRAMVSLLTSNRFLGVGAGILVTLFLSSSSAATVLFVGLANAGLVTLVQSVGLVLGAAIGTTLTVHIIAFKMTALALVFVAAGYLIRLASRYEPGRHLGAVAMGAGFVFYGMHLMQQGVDPIRNYAVGRQFITLLSNPAGGLAVALALTAIIQSSAATIGGLAMPLVVAGELTSVEAVPIVVGANVGTCVTALLGSLVGSVRGKQVALVHLGAKLLGAVLVLAFMGPFAALCETLTAGPAAGPARRLVANEHLLFNLLVVAVVLPLAGPFSRLVAAATGRRDRPAKGAAGRLAAAALDEPERALVLAHGEVVRMAGPVRRMLTDVLAVFEEDDVRLLEDTIAMDNKVDLYTEVIETYLSRLKTDDLTPESRRMQTKLLFAVGNLERIGDLVSREMAALARRKIQVASAFSVEAHAELRGFHRQVTADFDRMMLFLAAKQGADPAPVLLYENGIDDVKRRLEQGHFMRIQRGMVEAELTSRIYPDVLSALRLVHYYIADIVKALWDYHGEENRGRTSTSSRQAG